MADTRRSRFVPERWVVPVRPADDELRRRFEDLPLDERRRLARLSARPDLEVAAPERRLVAALARSRLARRRRAHLAAAVLGLLVLMTVWGFGRSGFPESAGAFFAAGATAGGLTWAVAAAQARRRQRAARAVLDRLEGTTEG